MNATSKSKSSISLGNSGNALVLLIGANLVLFVLLVFLKAFYFMTSTSNVGSDTTNLYHKEIFNYLILPSAFGQFIRQPWSLVSYMFTHENLLDVFANILWLGAFGYILQSIGFNKKIIPLYLYGGLLGGIFFIVMNVLLPQHLSHTQYFVGATLAVVAVACGATTIAPNYRIFPMLGGGIPLWILFAIYMLVDISTSANAGLAYILAVLFSAAIGFFVMYQLKRGNDYGEWMYHSLYKVDDLFNPDRKYTKDQKSEFFYQSSTRKPYETKEHITQERVDELLDKINKKGYHSLTKAEKEFLERASKN